MATETDPLSSAPPSLMRAIFLHTFSGAIEDVLEKVGKLVKEEAASHNSAKGTTSRRRDTILEHLQELVKWASVIASVNDFAKAAVDTFAKLLEYEVTRKKNSIEFVVVYHGFASTLSLVRYLKRTDLESSSGDEIDGFFDRFKETMEEFWTLAQVYVQAPRFARFIKAMSFEQKLKDIVKQNDDIQKSISLILQGYTAVSATEIKIDIKEIKSILSVIETFHDPTTGPEKKALKEAGDFETILNASDPAS
ncbi:hypothetical protein VNI00_014176 [Paramarasmius palmivorus]|uniref:Uncharacterized protein n=1 Tax=Paramarasmius palmivorus TaxID=297713 RepID=A0AAW0BV05_9AGAR